MMGHVRMGVPYRQSFYDICILRYALDDHALALVCDHVTTGQMLIEMNAQYNSGIIYSNSHCNRQICYNLSILLIWQYTSFLPLGAIKQNFGILYFGSGQGRTSSSGISRF
jgi:hypothetical protein